MVYYVVLRFYLYFFFCNSQILFTKKLLYLCFITNFLHTLTPCTCSDFSPSPVLLLPSFVSFRRHLSSYMGPRLSDSPPGRTFALRQAVCMSVKNCICFYFCANMVLLECVCCVFICMFVYNQQSFHEYI